MRRRASNRWARFVVASSHVRGSVLTSIGGIGDCQRLDDYGRSADLQALVLADSDGKCGPVRSLAADSPDPDRGRIEAVLCRAQRSRNGTASAGWLQYRSAAIPVPPSPVPAEEMAGAPTGAWPIPPEHRAHRSASAGVDAHGQPLGPIASADPV